MIDKNFKRKEARKLREKRQFVNNVKKSGKLAGATLAVASSLAPFVGLLEVQAQQQNPAAYSPRVNSFIQELANSAVRVANANDLYPSVMIAQAILESGYGTSQLSCAPFHNLFGIKGSYAGESVQMPTHEFANGQWMEVRANFRVYSTYDESLQDYADLLRGTKFGGNSYYSGAWRSNTASYSDATRSLQGKYATAPDYDSKLEAIIAQNNLTAYDEISPPAEEPRQVVAQEVTAAPTEPSTAQNEEARQVTVVSGDSVWGICHKFGISIDDFVKWNGIGSDYLIHPGQKFAVTNPVLNKTTAQVAAQSLEQPVDKISEDVVVKPGDSLWQISRAHSMSVDELKKMNNLDSNLILVGQRLRLIS